MPANEEQQQQQEQQQTGPGPAETTPEEAAAKAQRRRELMEEFFRLEDEYISHLDVEEKQRRWNERREVLVNALAAVDEYIRLQEENGWEDETEDA
ncbi:uncharacterized protein BO87DRAFT_461880 [Aspergillus neoniger CBS 115656]|uniref:Uncharacterized protein n=1 Tax=Aspergillus neoniger (strain CBS 115656) TaxID=1448310 RepID=A0A318YEC7_ASPNB|nr:hypothetical protein BO87DRAFT_461880 [Aspergillus neoniger CBS 115656]PYH31030.1 hypothetical protein BO87DRAFT_461880 [Aspergillus neoniger CBS 115656]